MTDPIENQNAPLTPADQADMLVSPAELSALLKENGMTAAHAEIFGTDVTPEDAQDRQDWAESDPASTSAKLLDDMAKATNQIDNMDPNRTLTEHVTLSSTISSADLPAPKFVSPDSSAT